MVGVLGLVAWSQPEDLPERASPRLMSVAWTSVEVAQEAAAAGWVSIPLLTHRFHFDAQADAFDIQKYTERIWFPERAPEAYLPGTFDPGGSNWSRIGVPNDDSPSLYTGWVDLDFERYAPVRFPEDHPAEEVNRIAQSYVDLAQVTRDLRPNARIILHGLVSRTGSDAGRLIVEEIVSRYDAISPSIYPRFKLGFTNLEQQLDLFRERLQYCAELREMYGVKLMPIVWKRYEPLDHGAYHPESGRVWHNVMPEGIGRAVLLVVAEYDPDGIIVFGMDGENHYLVDPLWPPDTPNAEAADETTRRWLAQIQNIFGN
jgi:hypothetical protein